MTTDNRTNEPNQNETKSGQEFCFTEAQVEAATQSLLEGADLQVFDVRRQEELRLRVRAALVAAAGAAPVLPSNTVDEDALAEVIASSRGFGNGWEQIPPLTREAYREVARAVAEWLKEQG